MAIDPILKHEIFIESLLLYYREYGEPVTKDIWLDPVPSSVTVAAYSPYSYRTDVMVDHRLLQASPAATLSQPGDATLRSGSDIFKSTEN